MQSFLKFLALAFAGAPRSGRCWQPALSCALVVIAFSTCLDAIAVHCAAAAVVDAQAQPGCTVSGAADDTLCCANMGAYTLLAMTNTANAAVRFCKNLYTPTYL